MHGGTLSASSCCPLENKKYAIRTTTTSSTLSRGGPAHGASVHHRVRRDAMHKRGKGNYNASSWQNWRHLDIQEDRGRSKCRQILMGSLLRKTRKQGMPHATVPPLA